MMHTRFAGRISFLFCAALLHAAVVASGETYTWTGAADNTWKNEGNWEGGKVFVSSLENDLVINKANAPIPNNTMMHDLTLNASVSFKGGPRIAVPATSTALLAESPSRFGVVLISWVKT